MSTLNELLRETAEIEAILEESGGELTPELEEAFKNNMDNVMQKIDGYGFLVRKLNANIEATKKIIDDMKASMKVKENNLKRLKEYILYVMKYYGKDKIEGDTCTVKKISSTSTEVDAELLLKPYAEKIKQMQSDIPSWIKLKAEISKTELKNAYPDADKLPEGMSYKENNSITIK